MSMFWIYNIPNWLFFIICITFFVTTTLILYKLSRKYIIPFFGIDEEREDSQISVFLGATGVFYSITIGLIAASVWAKYDSCEDIANAEATNLEALYADFRNYPDSAAKVLSAELKNYTKYVIEVAFPLQKKGITPKDGTTKIYHIQNTLYRFQPKNQSEAALHSEALSKYNEVLETRRKRLASAQSGLPPTLWYVIFFGGFLNIFLCTFFSVHNQKLSMLLLSILAALFAASIFLIAAMDYPFRGEFSIDSKPYELVYENMK
jgi:Protein of unknown function (DUF4239)